MLCYVLYSDGYVNNYLCLLNFPKTVLWSQYHTTKYNETTFLYRDPTITILMYPCLVTGNFFQIHHKYPLGLKNQMIEF